MVDIDKMQYKFMQGRRTVDSVFVLRDLVKNSAKNKKLFFIFADLWKRLSIWC